MDNKETRLPKEAYTTAAWLEDEKEKFWANCWTFLCPVSDLAEVGDVRLIEVGDFPLMAIHTKDGTLQAFHNVCRHRGATLIDEDGRIEGAIVCPYHRWTFGLNGDMRGAPNMANCFPGLDRKEMGLLPAALGVFKGLVFVNPDPEADFDEWIAPLAEHAWPHDVSGKGLEVSDPIIYELKCDWKVFVENAIDGYHLAYLHEHTLGGPGPEQNEWARCGDHQIWYAADGDDDKYYPLPAKFRGSSFWSSNVQGVPDHGYGGVYFMFPNTLIVPTPFNISLSRLLPLGPGRCQLMVWEWAGPWGSRLKAKDIPGYDKESGVITSGFWKDHPLETGDFQTEDVWICEKVQKGLTSPAYRHGPLSIGAGAEDPIRWFHESYWGSWSEE